MRLIRPSGYYADEAYIDDYRVDRRGPRIVATCYHCKHEEYTPAPTVTMDKQQWGKHKALLKQLHVRIQSHVGTHYPTRFSPKPFTPTETNGPCPF